MVKPFRHRLLTLREAEHALRAELAQSGEAPGGYHPRLRQLHEANARELELIIDDDGWPTPEVAGEDGAEAAWLIAMHAVSRPTFMRRCLVQLKGEANRGDAPPRHAAMLDDRIRALEGRPQRYGTQLDWQGGRLTPLPIEDRDGVDARRAAVGLAPLAETIATARDAAKSDGAPPPEEWEASSDVLDALAKEVGWR
ncbi:hypothetical protein CU669_02260 [Paramagnetospirillum kuznetsovii]|uniref:Uncharacterized protein n=1 Tax=Paramagnetospirillum kuznetsovii TaxID=2053833 RepID=A0A364P3P6_9PROT|nr:DUF6624 domain-containing protein [Paramagnetospirillum kuznetsovii]RAU23916.1 hypothetical protein CU669_02260 [Paramagnetospirillum kuznetsovii]